MSTFPGSPKLIRGGLVLIDPSSDSVRRLINLQCNPDSVSCTLQVQGIGDQGERSEALRRKGAAVETIKVEAEIDAADQRLAVWVPLLAFSTGSHYRGVLLGEHHRLTQRELNPLAATADICGGNIRNVVLAAAVFAQHANRSIGYDDIIMALAGEYRKLGRQMPVELMR
jgi:hypothetical protein